MNLNGEVRKNWVSVVVPTYNRSNLVLNALVSIYNQSYRPIEVIVIDDGSTDDTVRVVEDWDLAHVNSGEFTLRCIQQTNQGANAARSRGIREASGEFIAFLDSDDRWLSEKLSRQIPILQSDCEIGGVYCGLRYIDLETGQRLRESQRSYPGGWLLKSLLVHDVTEGTPTYVIRRSCFEKVGGFDRSLPARQDWDMWIRLASEYKIVAVPEVLVEAGEHTGERVRSNPNNEIKAHLQIFHKYAHLRAKFPFWVSLAARSAMYRRRGRVYFHRGISRSKALGMQLLAIAVWPFNFDSYAALTGILLPKGLRQNLRFAWNRVFGKTGLAIKTH